MDLTIELLGGVRVASARRTTGHAHGKVVGLLAYLAIEHQRLHSRDALCEMFWPDLPHVAARQNLRQKLLLLKGLTTDTFFSADRETIRVNPMVRFAVDANRFLALPAPHACAPHACRHCAADQEQRLALYRGEFLAGIAVDADGSFDTWLEFQRSRYQRAAVELAQRLAKEAEIRADYTAALGWGRRQLEIDPLHEEAHRTLMRLHLRLGDADAARRQYSACRDLLREELGIAPSAETQRLFAGIAESVAEAPASPAATPGRQFITVICAELAMPSLEDCELLAERIRVPHDQAASLLARAGAHVCSDHLGKLVAYFGYPRPEEGAARKAAAAALCLRQELATVPDLEVRIALHVGSAIIGAQDLRPDTVGHTTGAAARLALHAAHGEILLTAQIRQILEGYFHMELLPESHAWKLTAPTGAVDRIEARPPVTPFVGRAHELAMLSCALDDAAAGRSSVWIVEGEAGIGKSRLWHELRQQHAPAATWHVLGCQPQYAGTPFYPLVEFLTRIAHQGGEPLDPALHALLSPLPPDHPLSTVPPSVARERTTRALVTFVTGQGRTAPAVIVLEDLHWADPSTLEWLARLVRELEPTTRLLLIATTRPGTKHFETAAVRRLTLGPLDAITSQFLLNSIAPATGVATHGAILRLADGNPLYLEEVARAVQGLDSAGEVPLRLQELLSARLDSLGHHRELLCTAALIGREFELDQLREITEASEADARVAISHALATGIVHERDSGGYEFHHALVREAAYQFLPKARRESGHLRMAALLRREKHAPAEILAHHLAAGGEYADAIACWYAAGKEGIARAAYSEASRHFTRGLEFTPRLAPGPARDSSEAELLLGATTALFFAESHHSPQVIQMARRTRDACIRLGAGKSLAEALWIYWLSTAYGSSHEEGYSLARDFFPSSGFTSARDAALGTSAFWTGRLHESEALLQNAMEVAKSSLNQEGFFMQPFVVAGSMRIPCMALRGKLNASMKLAEEVIGHARSFDAPQDILAVAFNAAMICRELGLLDKVERYVGLCSEYSQRSRLPMWEALSSLMAGWLASHRGDSSAPERMRAIIDAALALVGSIEATPFMLLVESLAAIGDQETLPAVFEEAAGAIRKWKNLVFEPQLERLRGEWLVQEGELDEAEQRFTAAVNLAGRHGSSLYELKAASSLATLWLGRGRAVDAARLLAPHCARFETERGFPAVELAFETLAAAHAAGA